MRGNSNIKKHKNPFIFCQILTLPEYFRHILKNTQLSNLMKTRLEETDLFLAGGRVDGHTDRRKEAHDEASGRFPQFCEPV